MSKAGRKRKFTATEDGNGGGYQGSDDTEQSHTAGRLDLTFGQRSVFPGLDDYTLTGDEFLDHDDELGALSYLRSVREEATTIPTVLVAPKSKDESLYEDGVGDSRGWYSGGAYTAAPLSSTSASSEMGEIGGRDLQDPQEAFHASLISKYRAMRAQLNQIPPPEIQEKLDQSVHPTHVKKSKEGVEKWIHYLRDTSPNPVQLALMNKWAVLRLLDLLATQDRILRRGLQINENTCLWLLGLLARVPDPGELTSEQISIVRELGKKAILVGLGFNEVEDWTKGLNVLEAEMQGGDNHEGDGQDDADIDIPREDQDATMEDSLPQDQDVSTEEKIPEPEVCEEAAEGVAPTTTQQSIGPQLPSISDGAAKETTSDDSPKKEPETEDLEAAKSRLMSTINGPDPDHVVDHSVPSTNTKLALNMILTVAGEIYGQRDLLAFREKWDEE